MRYFHNPVTKRFSPYPVTKRFSPYPIDEKPDQWKPVVSSSCLVAFSHPVTELRFFSEDQLLRFLHEKRNNIPHEIAHVIICDLKVEELENYLIENGIPISE